MLTFEEELYFKCLSLAHQEFLETHSSPLNAVEIIIHAKKLFDEALKKAPKSPSINYLPAKTITRTDSNPSFKNTKTCPKCGEEVPLETKKHLYSETKQELCGQEF